MRTKTGVRALRSIGFATLLIASASTARAADTHPPPDGVRIAFEKYTLPNGLEVILSRDDRLPIVTINLWYHVGAIDERPGHTGFAHLFEHMMFEGSAHVAPGQHLALLERAGATDLNAETDFDHTSYFETVPSNYLETALWLESDRMGTLLQALSPRKFTLQRDVVENERRQTVDNTPYGVAEEHAWQALFPAPHPYHGDVIGSMHDLDAASVTDVRAFFAKYYTPSNATLTIAGSFDPLWLHKAIDRYFGSLPSHPAPAQPVIAPLHVDHPVVVEQTLRPGTLPIVSFSWHSPKALAPGDATADLMAKILSFGRSSRLERRLVDELQLAQSVAAHQQSLAAQSAFTIDVIARPHVALDRVQAELEATLHGYAYGAHAVFEPRRGPGPWLAYAAVRSNATATALAAMMDDLGRVPMTPFTEREVSDARRSLVDALPGDFESADDLSRALARIFWLGQPLDRYERLVAGLIAATSADVEEAAVRYMHPSQLAIVAVGEPRELARQLSKVSFDPPRVVSVLDNKP